MIKRPTLILLIILVLLFGVFLIIKYQPFTTPQPTPTPPGYLYVITDADGTLVSFSITDDLGNIVEMQRNLNQSWVILKPYLGYADQGLAGAVETQVGALRIITELTTPPELSDMGLYQPALTLDLEFSTEIHHVLEVGNLTPTGNGYYVRLDGDKVYVVSQSGIDSLSNILTNPPYEPTPTQSATSTTEPETGSPTMETTPANP